MTEVVTSVLKKLADVLLEKVQEVQAVRGQIERMQQELLLIQALLRDADSKCDKKELVTVWLNQVREISNTIATVIDTFRDKIEENRAESSNWFRKITKKITTDVKRNYKTYMLDLPGKLEDITQKLNWVYQRGTNLGIMDDLRALNDVDDAEPSDNVDDPEVVGLEDEKGKIIEQLLDGRISRRTVLSIVGTGGLGKTTLAQKVYNSEKLERQFDIRTWLTISQKYNLNYLLRETLHLVAPKMENKDSPVKDSDLAVKLKSSLKGKRYLIILDDVWDIDLWEHLKVALPDQDNASRVIITTRSLDVAKAADCNTIPYKLRYLSDAEGLALLFRNALQQHIEPDNYPHDLLDVAKRLMKKCGGLPLALVVLGGILTRRDRNYTSWNMFDETMDWHDKDVKKCSQVLAKSYKELPDDLKPCFLYFALFPEDHKISAEHVTRMWMAEGFISKNRAGTMENKADKFLEELVQRCLIQVTKKSWNGYYKYCSMHDLLRDMAIGQAKEENFFTIFSKEEEDVNQLAVRKPCRAALQFCTPTDDGIYSENTRSLLCFDIEQYSTKDCGFRLLNFGGFRELRVLTFVRVDMTEFIGRFWPKSLKHLRYLGLRYCKISEEILKNIFFYNLETLDLKGSRIYTNKETKKIDWCDMEIPTLRHVYGCDNYLPLQWNKHTNLQTIKNVPMQIQLVDQLGSCINLRTLEIDYVEDVENEWAPKEWENLKGVLRRTQQLVNLRVASHLSLPFGGTRGLPCHGKLQKLFLMGKCETNIFVLSVEMFPTHLIKLTLKLSWLEEDPMPIFERLKILKILQLYYESYVGTKMTCSTGGFPSLEILKLKDLGFLNHWDIKEGAMPILTHLEINDCDNLHTLPELQKVRNLQELLVVNPSRELRESMQTKDLHKLEHISCVYIS